MAKYNNHEIIKTAKSFLDILDQNNDIDYKENDKLVLQHILCNDIKDYEMITFISDILKKYVEVLCSYSIPYKLVKECKLSITKSTNRIIFKVDGDILKAYLPSLPKEQFLDVKDELKLVFGFTFCDNDKNDMSYWWKVVRDEGIFIQFRNSEILSRVGYQIDDSEHKSLLDRIKEIKGIKQKLFELSSAKMSNIENPIGFDKLFPFQRVPLEYFEHTRAIFITDKMGLGKTVQSLAVIEKHNLYPAVVVCPSVLKSNWVSEIEQWLSHRTTQILENGKKPKMVDIYILSYGTLVTYGVGLSKSPLKCVILDESHYIKNDKSQRTRNTIKYFNSIKNKILLTGTPILNRPIELIPQLDFLGVLRDHFGGKRDFIARYAPPSSNGRWITYGSANEEELQIELRKSCMIRRNKEDVLDELPAKTRQVSSLPLSNYSKYYEMERDVINWYKKKIEEMAESEHITLSEKQVELLAEKKKSEMNPVAEKLVKLNYLKQAAAEYKLSSVIEWLNNSLEQTDKIVVFAYHKDVIRKLEEEYAEIAVILKEETKKDVGDLVDRFQHDPSVKMFISSLKMGAFGLTLTAADKLVFVELGWNPGTMEQAEDRIHRIGQKNPVNIYYLLGHMTIDEYIYEMIINKGELIEKSTDINRIFELLQQKHETK